MGKYKKAIQENITVFREKKGMSKADLARACGVSKPTVSNWENGRNSLDADMIFKVAEVLDVSADVLAGRVPLGVSYEENKIIEMFRSLDDRGRGAVLETLNREYGYSKNDDTDVLSA